VTPKPIFTQYLMYDHSSSRYSIGVTHISTSVLTVTLLQLLQSLQVSTTEWDKSFQNSISTSWNGLLLVPLGSAVPVANMSQLPRTSQKNLLVAHHAVYDKLSLGANFRLMFFY